MTTRTMVFPGLLQAESGTLYFLLFGRVLFSSVWEGFLYCILHLVKRQTITALITDKHFISSYKFAYIYKSITVDK